MKKGTISRNITLLMEHAGIRSASKVARECGLPQPTINNLIAGITADPRISTLTPIAEYFDITLDALLSENPLSSKAESQQQFNMLIPAVSYDELIDIYENLSSLNTTNWPHWFPIPKQEEGDFYVVHLKGRQLLAPFEDASLLLVEHTQDLIDNTYCIVRHIKSNSVNIKKVIFDNDKKWLFPLQPELSETEYLCAQWKLFGTIQAFVTNVGNNKLTYMESSNEPRLFERNT